MSGRNFDCLVAVFDSLVGYNFDSPVAIFDRLVNRYSFDYLVAVVTVLWLRLSDCSLCLRVDCHVAVFDCLVPAVTALLKSLTVWLQMALSSCSWNCVVAAKVEKEGTRNQCSMS